MGQRAPLRERHEARLPLAAIVALKLVQVAAGGNESSVQAPLRELVAAPVLLVRFQCWTARWTDDR